MKSYKRVYDFYVEKDEEALMKYLVPEYYIGINISKNKVDVDYALKFLQNELNELLNSFINGDFSNIGFVLYPFFKDVSKNNVRKIERLKEIAVFLTNNGYDFSDSIRLYKNRINSRNFMQILSALYVDFSKTEGKNAKLVKKPKCGEINFDNYKKKDKEYIKPLVELKEYSNAKLKQYLSGFYLHGSFATKDYIKGWSDVDTLSIISKGTINDPESMLKLRNRMYNMRNFFYKIDPLQHHGSIVVSEYDMNNYCQAYFPTPVFAYAKSFLKDDKTIQFRVRDFSNESIRRLFWFVSYFRKLKIEKRFNLSSYDTKVLLHSITLFPTMYLQAKGILVYKKFSFDIAKKDFKKDIWKIIDNISSIRLNWKSFGVIPLINLFSKLNPLFYYQLNSKAIDLIKNIKKDNKIDTENVVKNMFRFSEESWSKIKKNVKKEKL